MAHSSTPDAHSHEEHAHAGNGLYIGVFFALCILTFCSFAIANWGPSIGVSKQATWVAMMAVSTSKALLVILFFMHLKWEANWKYVLTIPASLMSLFLVLMLIPDVGRRTRTYSDERWLFAPVPQQTHHDEHHGEETHDHGSGPHEHPAPAKH